MAFGCDVEKTFKISVDMGILLAVSIMSPRLIDKLPIFDQDVTPYLSSYLVAQIRTSSLTLVERKCTRNA